jgi:hypothetical protein
MSTDLHRNSLLKDIGLTVITFGFWNLWVQFRQIEDTNLILKRDKIPSFFKVILFSVLTLGIYFAYHEFYLTRELHKLVFKRTYLFQEVCFALMAFIGLWFIVDCYQQSLLNDIIAKNSSVNVEPLSNIPIKSIEL